ISIFGYFADLADQRRVHPGPDMVTALTQVGVDGSKLTDDEVVLNCDGLMNGGLETTPHAMSGALLAFAENPGQWRRLKRDRELCDDAVEEILRWVSPPTHTMRTAVTDTTLGDARILAGDRVVVWFPSCNRDESVFPEADRFQIDRKPNQHSAFGGGPHYCVGAMLARLEVRCLLGVMLRRIADIGLAGEIVRMPSNFLHGLRKLEVSLTPEPSG
ncbi:MAG: cytochrome P450, partial [Stackebrandtia sp.]